MTTTALPTSVAVRLEGVSRRFGNVQAIDGLDLEMTPGELVALLGPSGCGKTTALRILAGLEDADSGRILVGDKDVANVPVNRRNMGMVFQAYSLFPHLTALENVEFGLRVRGRRRTERARRAEELLELVGLGHAGKRYAHQLSGGMQQRVALARAIAIEPRVLLLDEPLSALDAKVRVQLREEIRRIQTQLGITTLYVTHDQEEALSVSDRVAVLSQGLIEQIGVPAEIYNEPATPFVAAFIGTMNRLEATVSDGDQGEVDYAGLRLGVGAARGRRAGERILVLVRPESLVLAASNGATGALAGEVISHTFLGAVTRVKVAVQGGAELHADVPSSRAAELPVGASVTATFDPAGARALSLESPAPGPDGP